MKKVYLASGFHWRYDLRRLSRTLSDIGYETISRWIWISERPERSDDDWPAFARKIAQDNWIDLQAAELLIIDANGISRINNGGVSTELGIALMRGIPIYLIGNPRNTFLWLPQVNHFDNKTALLRHLMGEQDGGQAGRETNRMGRPGSHYQPRRLQQP